MRRTEFNIIEQYFCANKPTRSDVVLGIGDDAAIIEIPVNQQLVVSVDTLVSDVHFFSHQNPFDIGYKALAVNLSDMAAMGAEPAWVTLALTLPENNIEWLQKFCEGFFSLVKIYNLQLIGGDTTKGPLSITVQIQGTVPRGQALRRDGAKVGDQIYVSHQLGDAAYALFCLQNHLTCDAKIENRLHRPTPRVDLGLSLREIASSAIDLSDGLAGDLAHIVNASHVGAHIDLLRLPLSETITGHQHETQKSAWEFALNGGDDYELCFTIPKKNEKLFQEKIKNLPYQCHCIGEIIAEEKIIWETPSDQPLGFEPKGFKHF